jgi:uncharacterized UBP type Zn finger protein
VHGCVNSSRLAQIVSWLFFSFELVSLTRLTAGEIIPPTRSDLPRGLNQLGNTCYLNSLLQVLVFEFFSPSSSEFWARSIFTPSKNCEKQWLPWQMQIRSLSMMRKSLMTHSNNTVLAGD